MRAPRAVLLAALFLFRAAAQDQNGSIIGVVVDSVSHQPLRKVLVTLEFPTTPGLEPQWKQSNTDDAGAFAFHQLKPGQYRLAVERHDYPDVAWKDTPVSASENPDPVTLERIPGAVVSGRILDQDGDPLNGCWPQVRPAEHLEQIVSPQIARNASEPSDYRLFGLPPGRYILTAQCVVPVFQPRPFSAGPDPPPSLAYPRQFYPAAPDAASAQPIELAPGTEKAGIDFRMRPAHVTQVRVVLAPSSAEWRGRHLFVRLIRAGDEADGMSPESSSRGFRFPQVFPGSYLLLATSLGSETRVGGIGRVEVKDQPVNTEIELKHAIDINGTVELERAANSANIQLQRIQIQMLPDQLIGPFISVAAAAVKQDGSFTVNSVIPAQWRFQVYGAAVFVKSVWLGAKELTGRTFDLSSGPIDTLKIVLSANTATILGTAPPGSTVAYRNLDDNFSFRESASQKVEQSGQFRIEGLAPGRYRVAVGESLEAIREDAGREITVREGETATVDLRS